MLLKKQNWQRHRQNTFSIDLLHVKKYTRAHTKDIENCLYDLCQENTKQLVTIIKETEIIHDERNEENGKKKK